MIVVQLYIQCALHQRGQFKVLVSYGAISIFFGCFLVFAYVITFRILQF